MSSMDRERLGRVLGKGARLAARTALEAVDAATAPPPAGPPIRRPAPQVINPQVIAPPQPVRNVRLPSILSPARLQPAARAAQDGVMTPLRRASRALWYELTGSFFALFALGFAVGVWHTRANAWSGIAADRYRFALTCGVALLFAYFSVSSFARARRRTAG